MDKIRCQSCGMPLAHGFYGTEQDGSDNHEYCKFCYERGAFTSPDLTLQGMVDLSVLHMMKELQFPEETARQMSESIIPHLKRWTKE